MYAFPRRSVGTRLIRYRYRFFLVPTLPRGNAYLCDEHFISSGFGEVTDVPLLSQSPQ